jgi:hypothetical protein
MMDGSLLVNLSHAASVAFNFYPFSTLLAGVFQIFTVKISFVINGFLGLASAIVCFHSLVSVSAKSLSHGKRL